MGSRSTVGAAGTLLEDVIKRIVPDEMTRQQVIARSMMLSVDNAHGIHPNYVGKHDSNHGPKLNAGPVVKFDANQSYATGVDTASVLRHLATKAQPIHLQNFVMRADLRCGSTIGPITATLTGIPTIDIGAATFGMHSIRETAGVADVMSMISLLNRFVNAEHVCIYE